MKRKYNREVIIERNNRKRDHRERGKVEIGNNIREG
jgi:hypothetical protein